MKFKDNFENNLIKILEKITFNSELVKELDCAENIKDIYEICKKLGYSQNIFKFNDQIIKIINCVQEISDENLEKVSGGKNNLQKTCAILLTAINVGSPMTSAINSYNNYISVPKQNNNKFKEKFDVFLNKTNNYVRRGFKQIGEFAKNNPKTTAGISLATIVSVPTFVTVANKISSCIENSRDIAETSEQTVQMLFSELCDIFNNIKYNPEKYYEKFECDNTLKIIPSNGYIFSFIVHAKNAGFNINSDIFNFSASENLSFINIINKLKNSTTNKYLLRSISNLLDKNIENIKINSKVIIDRFTTISKEEQRKKLEEERCKKKEEEDKKLKEEQCKKKKEEEHKKLKKEQYKEKKEEEHKRLEEESKDKLYAYLNNKQNFKNEFCKKLSGAIIQLSKSQATNVTIEKLLELIPESGKKGSFFISSYYNCLNNEFKYTFKKNVDLDDLKKILDQNVIYKVYKQEDDFLQELLILGHICAYLFNTKESYFNTKESYFKYDKCKVGFTDGAKSWGECLDIAQINVDILIKND